MTSDKKKKYCCSNMKDAIEEGFIEIENKKYSLKTLDEDALDFDDGSYGVLFRRIYFCPFCRTELKKVHKRGVI